MEDHIYANYGITAKYRSGSTFSENPEEDCYVNIKKLKSLTTGGNQEPGNSGAVYSHID